MSILLSLVFPAIALSAPKPVQEPSNSVLFTNVRVFNGTDKLTPPENVLVTGNKIAKISAGPLTAPDGTVTIDGKGRTLMPGLIEPHTHVMFDAIPLVVALTSDAVYVSAVATRSASEMLMRGFTSIRDLGGPVFGLKRAIDEGNVTGPRIWPSGSFISQTGGHGDFRFPTDMPAAPGSFTYSEKIGAAALTDSPDDVRKRAREQLALGASQIKLMAGGGVSSTYDPLDVTQYTVPEIRAAVEAAENWGTYVTVHAYTPRAVRQAIEAGVKCIDHGQLLDEPTAKLMADKGIWWSLQPFDDDGNSTFAEGTPNRIKQLEMFSGTDNAYRYARKYKIKMAWGTDNLFSAKNAKLQGAKLSKMVKWFSLAEALRIATKDNGELLGLSGLRTPYPGKTGVVEEGALADLLLVDGDPIANIKLVEDAAKNFLVIMKDGKIVKNIAN